MDGGPDLLSESFRHEKQSEEEEENPSWRDKPLHGINQQREEVTDIESTLQWLAKTGLKDKRYKIRP